MFNACLWNQIVNVWVNGSWSVICCVTAYVVSVT
jgi:hypothetical protein